VFDAIGSLTYIEDNAAATPEPTPARKAAPPTLHATAVATPMLRNPLDEGKAHSSRTAASEAEKPDWSGPPTLLAPPEEKTEAPAKEASKEIARRPNRSEPRADAKPEPRSELRADPRMEARAESKPEPKAPSRVEPKALRVDIQQADEAPDQLDPPQVRRRRRREAPAELPPEPVAQATNPNLDFTADEGADEPEFLRAAEQPRTFSVFYGGGSFLLAALLLIQLAVIFRTEITTRWPQWRPALVQLCGVFGCNVGWPTRAELLAIVGTELQAIPGTDVLELTAVVRNRASFKVALPAIEVTLTDTTNRTLARKVFAPVDYLASAGEPSSRIDDGLGAGSDYTIKVAFEARGVNAVGFVVYPFYL
jgi:hypothetical protein